MRNKRTAGVVAALAAILLGCFFMPNYVAGIIDRNTLDKPTIIDAKGLSFEASPDLTMPERLTLYAGSDHESITVKNGKKQLMESEARALVFGELRRFFGSSGLVTGLSEMTVDESTALFVIDAESPSINMIVLRFELSSASGQMMTVAVDEETGAILQIVYRDLSIHAAVTKTDDVMRDTLRDDAEELRELIGEYYGMPAVLTYEPGNGLWYYNVELDFNGVPVALYGYVRDSGFTLNE